MSEYKNVLLRKIINLGLGDEGEITYRKTQDCIYYQLAYENLGYYPSQHGAENALAHYEESDSRVIGYEIIGPQFSLISESDDNDEDFYSDESPQFHFVYDSNRQLLSSYFYDKENPGGQRLDREYVFQYNEIAWVREQYTNVDLETYDVLLPVKIMGPTTYEFLEIQRAYYRYVNDIEKLYGMENAAVPSKEALKCHFDSEPNMTFDSLVFKPLLCLRSSWGIFPCFPLDNSFRLNFLPQQTIV